MGKERLIVEKFKDKKVLLIGDSILDLAVYGTAIGKSLETPTIVAKETSIAYSFGGASLVARNLLELGAKVEFISLIGSDEEAEHYSLFNHESLKKHFVIDKSRRTTVKRRFWIDGYKLLQIDNLDNRDISSGLSSQVAENVKKLVKSCDAVIISDYRHGMLTEKLIKSIKEICEKAGKKVFVDSQVSHRESNHHLYKDCFFILLSKKEAKAIDPNFSGDFTALKNILGKSNICVKLGERGSICSAEGKIIKTEALKLKSIDTCGAGDAFLTALALSILSNGNNLEASLKIANCWAGLSTLAQGPNPPKKSDLLNHWR